jgi:hypothetical protein
MMIVHVPAASVMPVPVVPLVLPQVPPVIVEVAPFESTIFVVSVSPAAATRPLPVSFNTVTVNVCDADGPTSFVADSGATEMFASTIVQANEAGALALWDADWSTASTWNVWGPVPRVEKV